jgi:hypothetical protein
MVQSRRGAVQMLAAQVHPLVLAIPKFIQVGKNRQVGEKWVADDCSYLCKGLD